MFSGEKTNRKGSKCGNSPKNKIIPNIKIKKQ